MKANMIICSIKLNSREEAVYIIDVLYDLGYQWADKITKYTYIDMNTIRIHSSGELTSHYKDTTYSDHCYINANITIEILRNLLIVLPELYEY